MTDHQQSIQEDYLLLDWQNPGQIIEGIAPTTSTPASQPSHPNEPSGRTGDSLRARQPKPTNQLQAASLHSKHSGHPRIDDIPPIAASDSEALIHFYDLRAIRDFDSSESDIPAEIIQLHLKKSREKNGENPDELPEVWKAPPPPEDVADDTAADEDESTQEDVEMVQRAPNDDIYDDDASDDCRSVQGKYGERASKNPGIILRYQYELIQDLEGTDWTETVDGERDGTEYLMENIMPSLEQGVGDVLVRALFEECGGGMRRLSMGGSTRGRRGLGSTVVGLDGEPPDFPLGQGGEFMFLCYLFVF
jgi:hypothetical protein